MKKLVLFVAALAILGMTAPAHALFTNGGFEDNSFNGWTQEHGFNFSGLTLDEVTTLPLSENIYQGGEYWAPGPLGWITGVWTDNASISSYERLDTLYTPPSDRFFVTSGTDNDAVATLLPVVRYGTYSARVNSQDDSFHASRIWQEDVLKESDRDSADGKFHIRFSYAAVLENHGGDYEQPYFHITLKKNPDIDGGVLLENIFVYANMPGVSWNTIPPGLEDPTWADWFWLPWTDVDLDITDNVVVGDTIRIELSASDCSGGGHGGYAYLDGFRSQASATGGSGTLDIKKDGLGGGVLLGNCGMVMGRDGKGPTSGAESAGMVALYFGLLLLPVGILKLFQGRKRRPFEKGGAVALLIVASLLAASTVHAERLIVPKAQRFHPTTDGLGALTVDTDQTLCPGQFNLGLTLNGAKKPLDMGDTRLLKIEKVVVDELYTADLLVAYGLTPDITLGLDVPYEYSRDNLNYTQYKLGNTGVRDDVFHLGDIRLNAKFRVIEGARYGLALIPFANFATGNKDYLLSEGKFGFGMKFAGHYDVIKPLTLYANLGAEHVGNIATPSSAPGYYTPWIQYGVGAKYLLPWRKDSIVAEVNGETAWSTPFAHSTLSPLEVLAAYRAEVAPGWTLQAGGGGGLNKGMGAPQWRAILGIAYKM
ncbi:MAG: hypothetical protein PHP88_00390 [bacterium]|nr:hypothetical protein [bacterium]